MFRGNGHTLKYISHFKISPATKKDYDAYDKVDTNVTPSQFRESFKELSGYNPGSSLGNKQECNVCGKSGPECIGHPTVMDLSPLKTKFINDFGVVTISDISGCICRACKTFVQVKVDTLTHKGPNPALSMTFKELSKLPLSKLSCACGKNPTINQLKVDKEEKIPTVKCQKKPSEVKNFSENINDLYNLFTEVDFSVRNVDRELILNLFFDKIFLLPTCMHQMSFKPGAESSVDENTGMIKLYEHIGTKAMGMYQNIDEVKKKIHGIFRGSSENGFAGTPSYMAVVDGKEGTFRNESLNKQSDNTGRAVLTMGTGRACEIQIPEFLARNNLQKIQVKTYNKEWLQKKVGFAVSHRVVFLESSPTNMRQIYIKLTPSYKLSLGETVIKMHEDGEYILFSRHPILWRGSLIGYRAYSWNKFCNGLHEVNMEHHNADLDGDDGNILAGSDLKSRIEAQVISTFYNITGAHTGEPVIGIKYNGIVGAYYISTDDNIDPYLFNLLKSIIRGDNILDKHLRNYVREIKIDENYYEKMAQRYNIPQYSGKILFSMLLPKKLNYRRGDVVIENGILLKGQLKKVDVANKLILAIQALDKWRSPFLFIDRGYEMLSTYISAKGITISERDYVMPGELKNQVYPQNFYGKIDQLDREIIKLEEKKLKQTKASAERTEEAIIGLIAKLDNEVVELYENGPYRNTDLAKISYKSGARGNVGNVASAVTYVGQQYAGSTRLGSDRSRLTMYSEVNSKSIFDNGFVKSSFSKGLTPHEVFMLAWPGRLAAYMTYLGTPESGNASRQITLHLAGIHTNNSMAVEDREGRIIDSLYGYGCDARSVCKRDTPIGQIESPFNLDQIMDQARDEIFNYDEM